VCKRKRLSEEGYRAGYRHQDLMIQVGKVHSRGKYGTHLPAGVNIYS